MANDRKLFHNPFWKRLLWFLLFALPVVLLIFTPLGQTWGGAAILLLILLILNILFAFRLFRSVRREEEVLRPRMIFPEQQPEVVREVMDVCIATDEGAMRIFRGPLRDSPEVAYQKLKAAFADETALLQEDERLGAAIFLMPKPVEQAVLERPSKPAINWLLLFLTFLTTTWAGAAYQGINLLQEPGKFAAGLPYSLGLLAILGCHELGHYFAARRHNMNVTPPYFVPVPFALGTFGAFIKMKSPPEDRTSLFDMAIAGPLAGLVIAIPALLVGLSSSEVIQIRNAPELELAGSLPTNSILFGLIARFSLGHNLEPGTIIRLGPLAFAGSLGLLITALNLLPVGQLDGGHITRAIFGTRGGERVARITMWAFFLYTLFVPAFLMWAIIIFFLAGNVSPPVNDLVPISRGRRWLGYVCFLVLVLLIPLPAILWQRLSLFAPAF